MSSDQDLSGRIALVTGGSRGIGRAIAETLANAGVRVVVSARNEVQVKQVAGELPAVDGGHYGLAMDLADATAIETGLKQIATEVGHIDILVNNAGIAESKPYDRTDDELWERTMAVNATSVFRVSRALLPSMIDKAWGRVVIVASNAGLTGYEYSSAYCASKHAVIGWMRAVALEIARTPVTINAVCPGWVDTDMAKVAVERIAEKTGKTAGEARAVLERMSPQKRMTTPDEVAHLVLALCAPAARGIHGQAVPIDGGQVLR